MPSPVEMISLRTFRLSSTSGHVIPFEANKPRMVPAAVVQEAMAAGCAPTSSDGLPVIDDATKVKQGMQGPLRDSLIKLAIKRLIDENNVKSFDSAGMPKVEVLQDILGIDIAAKERTKLYREVVSATAAGEDIVLQAGAEGVLKVMDATSKSDLLALANDIGVPAEDVKGLSSRELRSLLIARQMAA